MTILSLSIRVSMLRLMYSEPIGAKLPSTGLTLIGSEFVSLGTGTLMEIWTK